MSSVSKCLKCGSELPPVGECPKCVSAFAAPPATPKLPSLLDQDLHLDRRSPTSPPAPPRIPSFAELSTGLKPPAVAPVAGPPPIPTAPRSAPIAAVAPVSGRLPTPAPAPIAPPAPVNELAPNQLRAAPPSEPARAEPPKRQPAPVKTADPDSEIHARPAALWRRLIAWAIDALVVGGVLYLYLAAASKITGLSAPHAQLPGIDGFVQRLHAIEPILIPGVILGVIVAVAYSAGVSILWQGRTLGRRLLGIRLVDMTGQGPTPKRTVTRSVLSVFSFALFLGGFWLLLLDRKRQTLHDKLTSTFVVQPS